MHDPPTLSIGRRIPAFRAHPQDASLALRQGRGAAFGYSQDPSLVARLALLPRTRLLGERQPYHQIRQTRLASGQRVKSRTKASLNKMPHKRSTAKSRTLQTNSDMCGCENIFNIRMLVPGGGNRGKFQGPLTLACHYDGAGRISSARCGIWAPGMPRRSPKNS